MRADELRTIGFDFKNEESKLLWDTLRTADFPVLIPHRPGREPRERKEEQIRREHTLAKDADLVFLEIELDDPSDFFQNLDIEVVGEGAPLHHSRDGLCVGAACHRRDRTEMSRYSIPPGLHFGWPQLDLLSASWNYLAFGEGNIPWKVRELITRGTR